MKIENVDFTKLSEEEREKLIQKLSESLPVLRTTLGMTQDELAKQIGVTRQTIASFESGKRMINWPTTIALLTIFVFSTKTAVLLVPLGIIGKNLIKAIPFLNSLFGGLKNDSGD